MPRIQPLDPSTATGPTAEALATTRKMFGKVPNLAATAAHSLAALTSLNAMFAHTSTSALGPVVGELVAVAVSQRNRCAYCVSAHTALGLMHGASPAVVGEAQRGRSADPRIAAILSLAIAVNETRGHVDDRALAEARSVGLTDETIMDIVVHVGLTAFTNAINNVAETTIDFPMVALAPAA